MNKNEEWPKARLPLIPEILVDMLAERTAERPPSRNRYQECLEALECYEYLRVGRVSPEPEPELQAQVKGS